MYFIQSELDFYNIIKNLHILFFNKNKNKKVKYGLKYIFKNFN